MSTWLKPGSPTRLVVLGSFGYGGREEGGEEPTRGPNTTDSILFPLLTGYTVVIYWMGLFQKLLDNHYVIFLLWICPKNQIMGSFPNLTRCSSLKGLYLWKNQFKGTLSTSIGQLPNLEVLDVNSNHLECLVSEAHLSNLSRLQFLDLPLNSLALEFSSRWIPPFHLDTIRLRSYTIPSWFWDPSPRTRLLNISYNQINGIVPDLSVKFPAFPAIDLSSNQFKDPIPLLPRTATSLNLSKNKFSGLRSNELHGSTPTNLCQLNYIQILDLSLNNISGTIPMCLGNFLAMTQTSRFDRTIYVVYDQTYHFWLGEDGYYSPHYILSALLVWKGREYEYKNTLGLVKSIDLSSHKLIGKIPSNITRLVGLVAMNFSRNKLTGPMPAEIGDFKLLESLDLSKNQLSGGIPISLSNLNFLSYLDLSDNNLSGRIPLSTQLQSLDNSTFVGNPELCEAPLTKVCPGDEAPQNPKGPDGIYGLDNQEDEDTFITTRFYVSMGLGFTFGFCGVFGSLILNRTWRYAYFQFLMNIIDWVYVAAALNTARLRTRLRI
ncbi:hypothetical protein ACSBR1_034959 [Camellia fascicularis]